MLSWWDRAVFLFDQDVDQDAASERGAPLQEAAGAHQDTIAAASAFVAGSALSTAQSETRPRDFTGLLKVGVGMIFTNQNANIGPG